jgi:hypothetical protein
MGDPSGSQLSVQLHQAPVSAFLSSTLQAHAYEGINKLSTSPGNRIGWQLTVPTAALESIRRKIVLLNSTLLRFCDRPIEKKIGVPRYGACRT